MPSSNPALAARMARFKALQASRVEGKQDNRESLVQERKHQEGRDKKYEKAQQIKARAEYNLEKQAQGDNFKRKLNMTYTAEESESWDKHKRRKEANAANNAFQDYTAEASKVYKRQIKQLSKVDAESYAAEKAATLQRQVISGVLSLVETDDGDVYTVDKVGRINTPAEENYNCDHKPSKEAVDRLVEDLEKGERARLKARAARGMKDDDSGDVTYINAKNKQFNDKLARFYNRYTTEIRESFERGTAI
ncbi:Pre-mRNA-splicing factor SYF2 [Lophiostoma macrostomum CBS 122681]|uniref:Pre-mRNA-splicing factor SYF2 n=1 Tax=Lophiostoma macrostomum CBS 122681 TaxID=1314788 RepID=A0A6A6TCH1_9PLEO|nr:Pre-mRNA-splicing factor SYF2 [Lophiostoma macrostomum CBS 122681]